jgi:tryptophan synthase alpha chain
MARYETMFSQLDAKNEGAFVPFVMLGDPDRATSIKIVQTLVDNGADALELGFPYSDPIADGPTIQAASIRALDNGNTPGECLEIIAQIRHDNPEIPIGLLLYSNLVLARGIEHFYAQAKASGVDSILIADVPLREAQRFIDVAKAYEIDQILIAPPNATEETLTAIGKLSSGYTYLLGRAGVTGAETVAETKYKVAPPLLGFGISTPEQVAHAIASGAAGAISGSATVNIIAKYLDDTPTMLQSLGEFVHNMKAGTAK